MVVLAGDYGTGSSGAIWVLDTDGTHSVIHTGMTDGKIVGMAQLNDLVFFGNGDSNDVVVDSTIHPTGPTVTNSGLDRLDVSGASSALGSADVNSVRGTVKYFVAPFANTSTQHARPDGTEGDQSDGWTNTTGSTNANLYVDIDEEVRDDSDYVITTTLTNNGGSSSRYFYLSDVIDPVTSAGHIARYVYKSTNEGSDVDVDVKLVEDPGGTPTTHATWTHTSIPSTWTLQEQTIATATADAITSYSDLALHFTFTNQLSSSTVTLNPVSDKGTSAGTWSPGTPFWSVVDANDNSFQSNTSAATNDFFTVKLQNAVDPLTSVDHTAYVRAKTASGENKDLRLDIIQASSVKANSTFTTVGTTEAEYSFTMSTVSADSITNYRNLYIRPVARDDTQFDIDQLKMTLPAPNDKAYLSWCELEVPKQAAAPDSFAEGPISVAFGEIDAKDGNDVDLSAVPLGSTGSVRLYRTYANGANPYYVTSLTGTVNTTTAYTDDLPDINLGDPPFNHGDPPLATYKSPVPYSNRLWWIREATSFVDYSDLAEPESYWNNSSVGGNWLEVFGDDGDVCTALAATTDGVIVFKRNHMYKIRGSSPEDFFVQQLTLSDSEVRSVGTPSTQTMVSTPSGLYFYWNKDLWEYDGQSIRRISKDIHDDLDDITESAESLHIAVGYWHAERIVLFSVPLNDVTGPTHTYMYDVSRKKFIGRMTEGFRGFSTIEDSSGNTEFWGLEGTVNSGWVYKFDDTSAQRKFDVITDDEGSQDTDIASALTLPSFYGHSVAEQKRFLYVDLYFETSAGQGGTVDVTYEIDGHSGSTTTVNLDMVDVNRDRNKRRINIGYIGRELRISLASNGTVQQRPLWKMYGWDYGYQPLPGVSN
jgi:hypothetical protein